MITPTSTKSKQYQALGIDEIAKDIQTAFDAINEVGGSSYKVYSALLTQTGTNPPVATVLENTLGLNPVFYYDGVGAYTIVDSSELFTNNKTYVLATGTGGAGISININDTTTIEIGCFNMAQPGGGNQNDMLLNAAFEIRVYN